MRGFLVLIPIALAGCDDGVVLDAVYKHSPHADIDLRKAEVALTQTSSTEWSLAKVGSTGGATVSWLATATEGATTPGLLIVNGVFRIRNRGNAGATLGNIVINLQTKIGHKWVTRSSVIADGTQDDDATTAIVPVACSSEGKHIYTENTASGHLVFTDATTNSAFALVPQVTIPADTTQKLRFTASFDNNVLHLPVGQKVRAEIIVSFGNAQANHHSEHDLDINGNGIIDPDEHWVRGVDTRDETKVPPMTPGNSTVTLSDSPSDITTTGTVTFSNPVIHITGTSGTVVVSYDGGASGGTITNCAHLTGSGQTVTVDGDVFPNINPINLTACDTQTIGPHTCSPGAPGCGWEDGDMVSYGQDSWGGDPTMSTAAGLLMAQFDTVYPGGLEVGIMGAAGFSMAFTAAAAVLNYQPSSGLPGPLTADLVDPTTTSSGFLGGNVLAHQLNISFTDAGLVSGTSSLLYGDLRVCALTATPAYNGLTLRQLMGELNTALGAGATPYSYDDLNTLAMNVTTAFEGGSASLFAQAHLFSTPCP